MGRIIGFIGSYWRDINRLRFALFSLYMAILIWLNYSEGLEHVLTQKLNLPWGNFTGHLILYSVAFLIPVSVMIPARRAGLVNGYYLCLIAAPVIFAFKVSVPTNLFSTGDWSFDKYWNSIIYWPLRFAVVAFLLGIIWFRFDKNQPFYGLSAKEFKIYPYLLMLMIMLPLIVLASTQHDFLATYPKLQRILPLPSFATPNWLYLLFFELGYGSDFLSIELFFRGFLILGFTKWLGKDAILPMACFYCSIHFGKPMGECISSYFGGLLLGIISYHTRSIYGGLIVHLGIAWLMEVGGFVGNLMER